MDRTKDGYKEYIDGGSWKCNESPSGAHHWVQFTSKNSHGGFECKWCHEVRWFPITMDSCLDEIHEGVASIARMGIG